MAKVIDKAGEKIVIWAVRELLPQRFTAPGWIDLRIGFLLSIVGPIDPTDDDDPTEVGVEEIGTVERTAISDRFFIGVLDGATGQTFMGFTNIGQTGTNSDSGGTSNVVSSDGGIGTDNAYFWRPANLNGPDPAAIDKSVAIIDGGLVRAASGTGSQIHFPQDTANAGGYATLLMLRLQRDNAAGRAKIISVSTKRDVTNHTANVVFTDTPSKALLTSYLIDTFPNPAQTLGPLELSQEPNNLYLYWPFHDSRLRCHAMGIYKAA